MYIMYAILDLVVRKFVHDIQFHSLEPHVLGPVDTKVKIKYKRPGHGPLGTTGTLQVLTSWGPWGAT